MYKLSKRSLDNMKGIDERLVILIGAMLDRSPYDFIVTEGLRTKERQAQLFKEGKSKTMNSKHLLGRAFDVAMLVDGKVNWDSKYYKAFAIELLAVAKELNFQVTWGGSWGWDSPHFEI